MDIIEKLTEIFKEFPGIGERQAKRFVYFLMSRTPGYNENLSSLIIELKKEVAQCKECFRFFILSKKGEKLCDICANTNVDSSILMIVEKDSDLESVKKSRIYNGKYFILGGLVPIVEKNTKSRIRIEELKQKISKENGLKEVILAFSLSPQGDHTDSYVRNQLKDIAEKLNIKVSSLGKGLSTGTELEYSDNDTLKNALKNRQ
ncbi:MAG: toprim domain-containing protein [Candidatus Nomurabacteria bacterium]|nr:toprim domain-containing protein [Candidatus Nomurabacteria bacterium]